MWREMVCGYLRAPLDGRGAALDIFVFPMVCGAPGVVPFAMQSGDRDCQESTGQSELWLRGG
jgi:hypothetical protein